MSVVGEVLMMAGGYTRLRADLSPYDKLLLLMGDDGVVRHADSDLVAERPEPAGAWYGRDAWHPQCARAFLDAALGSSRLVWLHSGNAGIDAPLYAPFIDRGTTITTSHGFAVGIADYVLAGVLDHWQRGPERRARRAAREWRGAPSRELQGSQWLIVGFGEIGREIARRAKAFGAQVTGVRRKAGEDTLADAIVDLQQLPQLLPQADVVILCASLNSTTRGLADAGFFQAMKPDATFANVGRGALVDEAALLAGLAAGHPGHAILDVFAAEPLPPESPFWDHPQVAMTPHVSWDSDGATARNDRAFLDNFHRFRSGDLPLGVRP